MTDRELQMRLAQNVRNLRKSKKLTQSKFAELANISEDTVKSVELMRAWVSAPYLAAIATALNVDVYELFLPIPTSFEVDEKIKKAIVETAKKSFKTFLDTVKEDIE